MSTLAMPPVTAARMPPPSQMSAVLLMKCCIFIRKLLVYHFVNGSPVRQSAQVAVVDEEVCFQFARVVIVLPFFFFGVIAVDGIKIQSAFMAELYSLVQQATFAYTP